MAARIEVSQFKPGEYRVRVIEAGGETSHIVTLQAGDHQRLAAGKAEPEESGPPLRPVGWCLPTPW